VTLEDCVNSRIRYLESLPATARDVWISASYELWAREAFTDDTLDSKGNDAKENEEGPQFAAR
jgi:hypothetical protein